MLTTEEIRTLIELCQQVTVAGPSSKFPYRIVRKGQGYEGGHSKLLAKLSMMLEAAHRRDEP